MLIDFSVENYRSFKDEVTLSMIAGTGKELPGNKFQSGDVELLRSAGIYGANASGKSNLVQALRFVQDMVVNSGRESQRGDPIPVQPFALDPECADMPSRFEVTFRARSDGKKYVYSFSVDETKVVAEELIRYDTRQPTKLFVRGLDGCTFSSKWRGGADAEQLLQKSTGVNALLLSVAARFNAEDASAPFDWFEEELQVAPDDRGNLHLSQTDYMFLFPRCRAWLLDLLGAADVGISDLVVTRVKDKSEDMKLLLRETYDGSLLKGSVQRRFLHRTRSGREGWMDWEDESAGTRELYALAGWVYQAVMKGHILVVDELEASLHPNLQEYLVRLFNDPKYSTSNAQLVFTTHNTNLMDNELLRREQIWLIEKSRDGASDLYSLWDFKTKPRLEANYETQYLHGRFGAIPILGLLPRRGDEGGE